MRRTLSVLATAALAAGMSLVAAGPAQAAGPYCFGLPDEPLAYVCVTVNDAAVPDPTITWGEPVYVTDVPRTCYGLGCTEPFPLYASIPWVSGVGGTPSLVEIYWGGQDGIEPKGLVSRVRYIVENPGSACSEISPWLSCELPPLLEPCYTDACRI